MRDPDRFPPLNLPRVELKTLIEDNIIKVFDPLRKKYVALTPEENVRQHFTSWLINSLHYPASLTENEVTINLNGQRKRCDTVVFDNNLAPLLIIEYKAPGVIVNQSTFDQIVRYNMSLKARYLVVTNGINHYCCKIDYNNSTYHFIARIPDYHELNFGFNEN